MECLHMLAHAASSEGRGWGGDQIGTEVYTSKYATFAGSGGLAKVYRFRDPKLADEIAKNQADAVLCGHVGYGNDGSKNLNFRSSSYTRALLCANYSTDNGKTFTPVDYKAYVKNGMNRQYEKDGKKYYFWSFSYVNPLLWNPYNVKDEVSTHCSALTYTSVLMATRLWFHSQTILGNVYTWADTQPSDTFTVPYSANNGTTGYFTHLIDGAWSNYFKNPYSGISCRTYRYGKRIEDARDIYNIPQEEPYYKNGKYTFSTRVVVYYVEFNWDENLSLEENYIRNGVNSSFSSTERDNHVYTSANAPRKYYNSYISEEDASDGVFTKYDSSIDSEIVYDANGKVVRTVLYRYRIKPMADMYIADKDGKTLLKAVYDNGDKESYEILNSINNNNEDIPDSNPDDEYSEINTGTVGQLWQDIKSKKYKTSNEIFPNGDSYRSSHPYDAYFLYNDENSTEIEENVVVPSHSGQLLGYYKVDSDGKLIKDDNGNYIPICQVYDICKTYNDDAYVSYTRHEPNENGEFKNENGSYYHTYIDKYYVNDTFNRPFISGWSDSLYLDGGKDNEAIYHRHIDESGLINAKIISSFDDRFNETTQIYSSVNNIRGNWYAKLNDYPIKFYKYNIYTNETVLSKSKLTITLKDKEYTLYRAKGNTYKNYFYIDEKGNKKYVVINLTIPIYYGENIEYENKMLYLSSLDKDYKTNDVSNVTPVYSNSNSQNVYLRDIDDSKLIMSNKNYIAIKTTLTTDKEIDFDNVIPSGAECIEFKKNEILFYLYDEVIIEADYILDNNLNINDKKYGPFYTKDYSTGSYTKEYSPYFRYYTKNKLIDMGYSTEEELESKETAIMNMFKNDISIYSESENEEEANEKMKELLVDDIDETTIGTYFVYYTLKGKNSDGEEKTIIAYIINNGSSSKLLLNDFVIYSVDPNRSCKYKNGKSIYPLTNNQSHPYKLLKAVKLTKKPYFNKYGEPELLAGETLEKLKMNAIDSNGELIECSVGSYEFEVDGYIYTIPRNLSLKNSFKGFYTSKDGTYSTINIKSTGSFYRITKSDDKYYIMDWNKKTSITIGSEEPREEGTDNGNVDETDVSEITKNESDISYAETSNDTVVNFNQTCWYEVSESMNDKNILQGKTLFNGNGEELIYNEETKEYEKIETKIPVGDFIGYTDMGVEGDVSYSEATDDETYVQVNSKLYVLSDPENLKRGDVIVTRGAFQGRTQKKYSGHVVMWI